MFLFIFIFLIGNYNNEYNPNLILGCFILVWVNDTFAFIVGSKIGKQKLFLTVSPKKTVEGFLGGLLFSCIASYFIATFTKQLKIVLEEKKNHKSGFISIIGNPNVGKSTLMNALVGKELSIITDKVQTTRHRILGIINGDDFQMVLSDTPGVIKPAYEMQNSMMTFVKEALVDADILVYVVSPEELELKDEVLFEKIKKTKGPLLILINKIDFLFVLFFISWSNFNFHFLLGLQSLPF